MSSVTQQYHRDMYDIFCVNYFKRTDILDCKHEKYFLKNQSKEQNTSNWFAVLSLKKRHNETNI